MQRLIESLLKDISGIMLYLNNIIIGIIKGKNPEQKVLAVLKALIYKANLHVCVKKCKFRRIISVVVIGYLVSPERVRPDSAKVEAIFKWNYLTNSKGI